MYILHIWSMFGIFMVEIHESLMRISYMFIWLIEGEKPCSFQMSCFYYVMHWGESCLCHSWSCILYFLYFSKFWSWVFLCWWHFYSYSPYVWCVLLSVLGNIIPFVNLWQKGGVKIGDMMDDSSNWFCHQIAKMGVCKFLLA